MQLRGYERSFSERVEDANEKGDALYYTTQNCNVLHNTLHSTTAHHTTQKNTRRHNTTLHNKILHFTLFSSINGVTPDRK